MLLNIQNFQLYVCLFTCLVIFLLHIYAMLLLVHAGAQLIMIMALHLFNSFIQFFPTYFFSKFRILSRALWFPFFRLSLRFVHYLSWPLVSMFFRWFSSMVKLMTHTFLTVSFPTSLLHYSFLSKTLQSCFPLHFFMHPCDWKFTQSFFLKKIIEISCTQKQTLSFALKNMS